MRMYLIKIVISFLLLNLFVSVEVAHSRQKFTFDIGGKIAVFSDKAYRRFKEKKFEAVGNVVIVNGEDTLYGESASMDIETGELIMRGNVRYINKLMTLYGSNLLFNTKTKQLEVENARIITDAYYVIGKKISRQSENVYLAEEAEYTTCRDCPESWMVYGDKVRVNIGSYVHIKNALLKVNGLVVMYLPYVVLPLKTQRETGLLFPKFALSLTKGVSYQQPWFWAINDSKDLTLTPSTFGRRGMGTEFQYRHVVGENKWFELDSIHVADRIYTPYKSDDDVSGTHYYRFFGDYEQNLQFENSVTHHLRVTKMRDKDTINDFSDYTDDRVNGSEVGYDGFIDYRNSLINLGIESTYTDNYLTGSVNRFDEHYVQILPKIKMGSVPVTIFDDLMPGVKNISLGFDSSYTVFKQNHILESPTMLRNVERSTFDPYINWHIFNYGPVSFQTKYQLEYQDYDFRGQYEKFSKYGAVVKSEVSFEMDRVYGLSFKEKIPIEKIPKERLVELRKKEILDEKIKNKHLIGDITKFEESFTKEFVEREKRGYRHAVEFKFLHYYTTDQSFTGNTAFYDQINLVSKEGIFDYKDAERTREHLLGNTESRTDISQLNTFEFQWRNSLIQKSASEFDPFIDNRYLRQNFKYDQTAYLNLSQGIELNTQREVFTDDLTRLHSEVGFNVNKWHFDFNDYYFYQTGNHVLSTNVLRNFLFASAGIGYTWNTLADPLVREINFIGNIQPIDTVKLYIDYKYDLFRSESSSSDYKLEFSPKNNCWKLVLDYGKDLTQNKFAINFLINFSDNNFTGLGQRDGG